MAAAFDEDWALAKVDRIINSDALDLRRVREIARQEYPRIRYAFKEYACLEVSRQPASDRDPHSVGVLQFQAFCRDLGMLEGSRVAHREGAVREKHLQQLDEEALGSLFIATNVNKDACSGKSLNRNTQLQRYEFLEAVVRLAVTRYLRTKEAGSIAEAMQMLMQRRFSQLPDWDTDLFRWRRLYGEAVAKVLEANVTQLDLLFSQCQNGYRRPGSRKKQGANFIARVELVDYLHMLEDRGVLDHTLTADTAVQCFARSVFTFATELDPLAPHKQANFYDFMESVCRLADGMDIDGMPAAKDHRPLADKLELFLADRLLGADAVAVKSLDQAVDDQLQGVGGDAQRNHSRAAAALKKQGQSRHGSKPGRTAF